MSLASVTIGPNSHGASISIEAPVAGAAGNGLVVSLFISGSELPGYGYGPFDSSVVQTYPPYALEIGIGQDSPLTSFFVSQCSSLGWPSGGSPDSAWGAADAGLAGDYVLSGGVDDYTTATGSAAGSATVAAIGAATTRAVGLTAGSSTVTAHSGVHGNVSGTSTAVGVGGATFAARGQADGFGGAHTFTGLRQSAGHAAGTSGATQTIVATSRRTDIQHVELAINRLCEVFKEAAV